MHVPRPKKGEGLRGTLSDRWIGLCRVVKKLDLVTFVVLDLEPPDSPAIVHINNLRP